MSKKKTVVFHGDPPLELVLEAKTLGRGQFGVVNFGYNKQNKQEVYAVKTLRLDRIQK